MIDANPEVISTTTPTLAVDTVLSVRDLEVIFGVHGIQVPALKGISFDITQGQTVALVGESGSGKSVTAQAIMGILPRVASITNGEILFRRRGEENEPGSPIIDLASLNPTGDTIRSLRGGDIAMIFQEPMVSLSPLHTLGDQISEALHLHRDLDYQQGQELTERMLKMVGFPDPARGLRTYPFELSGGLRQRAMIAMALVCRPSLLIADEPTTALDVTIQAQILNLMNELQSELEMAVLLITHDLGVVANMADHVVVMYHGEIMEHGPVDALFNKPQHDYLHALHRAVPRFNMQKGERLTPIRDIPFDPNVLSSGWARASQQQANSPATTTHGIDPHVHLQARNLNKSYAIKKRGWLMSSSDKIRAVNDVSFDVMTGECFGLVGESGCGKSTLSKLLMSAVTPDSGDIHYYQDGSMTDIRALENEQLAHFRRKMQMVFQDPFSALNPRMTVFNILREPLVIHRIGSEDEQVETVKNLIRLVGLDPRFLNRYPHSFSGGQRQRLGIARALALQPKLLICDEPVSALDVSIQAQILNLLKDLQAELNLTYLFISHNLAVVDYMATRIAVMCRGMLVEVAPRARLFEAAQHPYTRALLDAVPSPTLDDPLNFEKLLGQRFSEPTAWPHPWRVADGQSLSMQEVEPDHFVRCA